MRTASKLLAVSLFLIGCMEADTNPDPKESVGRDYNRLLPGGYKICRSSASEICLADSKDKIVIAAKVQEYSHADGYIFGRVISEGELFPDKYDVPGYFVVEIKTGYVNKGLEYEKWISMLNDYKVIATSSKLELRAP